MAVYAQQIVFDPAVLSTLVINHEAQQRVLVDIKEKETNGLRMNYLILKTGLAQTSLNLTTRKPN